MDAPTPMRIPLIALFLVLPLPVRGGDILVKEGGSIRVNPGASITLPMNNAVEIQDGGEGTLDEGTIDADVTVRDGGTFTLCGTITGVLTEEGTIIAGCPLEPSVPVSENGDVLAGDLSRPGERDRFELVIDFPATVRIFTRLATDTFGRLLGSDGTTQILSDDNGGSDNGWDDGNNGNFGIEILLVPGTWIIEVSGKTGATGAYQLVAEIARETVRPDGQIGLKLTRIRGNNVYNTSGAGQSQKVRTKRNGSAKYFIAGQNDSSFTDGIRFRMTRGNRSVKSTVLRLTGGVANVTGAIGRQGFVHLGLAPGQAASFLVKLKANRRDPRKLSRTFRTDFTSHFLAINSDRVIAKVIKPKSR